MLLCLVAVFAGFVTAFSPCIAPILPLYIIRGSKPLLLALGIALGTMVIMVASLLLLSVVGKIFQFAGILVLTLSGILLLWDKWSILASRFAPFGMALGWTPCLGPIAAGIVGLGSETKSWLLLVLYCLGLFTGVFMCSSLVSKATRNRITSQKWNRVLGILLILLAMVFLLGLNNKINQKINQKIPFWGSISWSLERGVAKKGLQKNFSIKRGQLPQLEGNWLTKPTKINPNKPTLLVFWSYTCAVCQASMPKVDFLKKKYNLDVILIHSPEFPWAIDNASIESSVEIYGLKDYPLLKDNNRETWTKWGASQWPWHVLVKNNKVVSSVSGEGLEIIEASLQKKAGFKEFSFSKGQQTDWTLSGKWKAKNEKQIAIKNSFVTLKTPGQIFVFQKQTSKGEWINVQPNRALKVAQGDVIQAWRSIKVNHQN